MNYWLGVIGTWIFSDAALSLALYLNAPSYRGKKQTWRKDHYIRVIRAICGIILIVMGTQL